MRCAIGPLLVLIALSSAIVACEEDPVVCVGCDCDPAGSSVTARDTPAAPCPAVFQNLTKRSAVLNNMEIAYNKRRLDKYEELLDPNFTFFLTAGDVAGGLPPSWGRADEITASTNLFSQQPAAPYPRCWRIQMDIRWEDGLAWTAFNPDAAPDEVWYKATVFFYFKVDVEPNMTYLNEPSSEAQFTVRNAGTDQAPRWQLVEMHELPQASSLARASSTVQTTWGQVKAIYR